MTKESIIAEVKAYLDKNDWHYKYDSTKELITGGVSLKSKLKSAKLNIVFNNNGYTVYGVSDLSASEDTYTETAKYLHKANYGLRNGNFEMDFRDGEVRFKIYVNAKGMSTIPTDIIEDSIILPFVMLDRYGNGLAAIALGFSDADTEIEKAEKK